jgi:hypothetical protein
MQGGLAGHGLDKNELLLRKAQGLSDLAKLVAVMANFTTRSSFTNHLPHFEGEKVFGFAKRPVDCPPSINKHSHHPNHVNFYHPWVFVLVLEPNFVKDVDIQQLPFGFSDLLPLLSQDGLELKKNIYVDGQWSIVCYPPKYATQCSSFQKTMTLKCKANVNIYK